MSRIEKKEEPAYKRVLLKLSGESIQGTEGSPIDGSKITSLAQTIKDVKNLGVELAIIIGGGNIIRGSVASGFGIDRCSADYMGMLATVINSIALQNVLEKEGVPTRVQTAIEMNKIAEPYIRRKAITHLEKNRVVIFAAGTGNPYFTTDTAAVLRAIEIGADVILKATKVDGVYDRDPMKYKSAVKLDKLSYMEVISRELKVMDSTAISLCMENKIPIVVFDVFKPHNIANAVRGKKIGSIIF